MTETTQTQEAGPAAKADEREDRTMTSTRKRMTRILIRGYATTVEQTYADHLAESGVAFAYLCKRDGRTVTIPVNSDK